MHFLEKNARGIHIILTTIGLSMGAIGYTIRLTIAPTEQKVETLDRKIEKMDTKIDKLDKKIDSKSDKIIDLIIALHGEKHNKEDR